MMRQLLAIRRAPALGLLLGILILPVVGCGDGAADGTVVKNSDDAFKKKMDKIEQIKKENYEKNQKGGGKR